MRAPSPPTWAVAAGIVVLAAAVGVGTFAGTRAARAPHPVAGSTTGPTPGLLARATAAPPSATLSPGRKPDPSAVRAQLASALDASGLGDRLRARVLDVASGRVLLDRDGTTATAPASTTKLVTAAAVLTTFAPGDRITTKVVSDGHGTLTLVGTGDPTLTAAAAGTSGAYAQAARLSDLAKQVKATGAPVRRVVVDGSRFTGPAVSRDWAAEDVPSSYGAAITALMADGGRATPGATERSATPDLDAGRSFARLLGSDVPVARGRASGKQVAAVRSAPYRVLVEQMLRGSDNVLAEVLGRDVAVAGTQPGSFAGGAAAVRTAVRKIGIDPGAGLRDSSGLAPADRVPAAVLAQVLRLAAAPATSSDDTAARLRSIVTGLPVAAWSGTLAARYRTASDRAAAGVVRAKTGTLTGVSSLAGLVHDRDGRLIAFALVADRTGSTPDAQAALDAIATRLAACGCSG